MSKSQKMLPYYYIIIYFIESAIDRNAIIDFRIYTKSTAVYFLTF